MNAINVVRFLNKPFLTKVKTLVSPLKNFQRNYNRLEKRSSFDMKTQMKSDVVLFQLEKKGFFIAINALSAFHCALWTFAGLFLFPSLNDPRFTTIRHKFWEKVIAKEREYINSLSFASIFFGIAALIITALYSSRSIRKIILHKGGGYVTVVTYNLPGYNTIKLPITNVSALEQRIKAKKYIPMKLKNNYFYYLVDVTGEFKNPELFDFTVGLRRNL